MKPTILIVEDHDVMRISLRDWLSTTFPDCHYLEARSGEEGLTLALSTQPDIVLMDIGFPQMNGIEATRCIKAAMPQAKVVILTIHEDTEYKVNALAAGASAYLLKRKILTDLLPVLSAMLSRNDSKEGDGGQEPVPDPCPLIPGL